MVKMAAYLLHNITISNNSDNNNNNKNYSQSLLRLAYN